MKSDMKKVEKIIDELRRGDFQEYRDVVKSDTLETLEFHLA